jgi:glyoxylase-like metal-dependent hydrolase (beta-lactamase superfamily II)
MVYGFPPSWPNGTQCASEDPIFVWKYADDTYILRQSLCTSFEGPFLYLFFGDDKALLEDTGDGGIPVQATVQQIVDDWLTANGKTSIELVVAHSHAHGDHVAGDGQFQGQPNTVVVGTGTSAVQTHFGISSWPDQIVEYDLGNRVIDVIPIPGHQTAHVAFFDRRHALLLTGDTLYPGRLYISDFTAYRASTQRLADFVAQSQPTWVLGTHIEMTTTPQQDFPFGADQHPNEHVLELTGAHVTELNTAVQAMGSSPVIEEHADFIIYPL